LDPIASPPNASIDSSYYGNMLVLPMGQILLTDFSNNIEICTPQPPSSRPDWAPRILHAPRVVQRGSSYLISGVNFNGISQGGLWRRCSDGDQLSDRQDYKVLTGHVFYSRTHDHSMAVASEEPLSTHFEVPASQEAGVSRLEVVANGVASLPVLVYVE
jgi:hypothetical protein